MLDWVNVVGSPARPTAPLKVVLYLTMPDQELGTGGVEVMGGGYTAATVVFDAASGGATSNIADVTFPMATGADWGMVAGIGIRDSASPTPLLIWTGTFVSPRQILDGQQLRISSGALTMELD